jgi:hypothetical protein
MMIRMTVIFLVLAAAVSACGHPLIPASALSTPASHAKSGAPAKRSADSPPSALSDGAGVGNSFATVIGSQGTVVGVDLYATDNYSTEVTTDYGVRMLSYIKNVLHADAVDIVWQVFAPNDKSNVVDTTSTTLSAANVGILTSIAQQYGLMVAYRPLMFTYESNDWEGLIEPTNPSSFFESYYRANLPYLEMAQKYHVNEFVAGTEMDGVIGDPQWYSYISKISSVYSGAVSYAAHEGTFFPPTGKLTDMTYLGIDMYEKSELPASATEEQVAAMYESYFARLPASALRRTAIIETGIEARDGAYQSPASLNLSGNFDPTIQYNWFTAACQAAKKFQLRAVFFWKVDLADNPDEPASSLSTFEGREGADAIASCATIING